MPLGVLKDHLRRHYGDRRIISPAKFEELVRAVFRDFFDCEVEYYTGHTNRPDGGIDLIMVNRHDNTQIAVQVKRRSRDKPESVRTIREFVGAMVIEGLPRGVFVTTKSYTRIAKTIPQRLESRADTPAALELVDAPRFYDMLKATARFPASEHPWWDAIRRHNAQRYSSGTE